MSFIDLQLLQRQVPYDLYTWGNNSYGLLGDNKAQNYFSWTNISVGNSHAAAIRSDGTLWAWGLNSTGQLGVGDLVSRSSPVQVGFNSWISVSAGNGYTVGITNDYTLKGTGTNTNGQLGTGDTVNKSLPTTVITNNLSFVSVNANYNGTVFALTNNNLLYTWGFNTNGELGNGTTISRSSPVQIGSFTVVTVGERTSYGIDSLGRLFSWGSGNFGGLGNNTTNDRSSPVQVGSSSWSAISAFTNALAITTDGKLFAWGNNQYGQLGLSDTTNRSSPVQVGTSSWSLISAGGKTGESNHVLGELSDGSLYGWGSNGDGQLGLNDTSNRSSPVLISISNYSIIDAGNGPNSAVVLGYGSAYLFGIGAGGVLGNGNTISRSSPTQLTAGTNNYSIAPKPIGTSWSKISIGLSHALAIKSNNTLYAWGFNDQGQLGLNDTITRSSPIQIGSGTWTDVHAGPSYSVALRSDNLAFGWGYNDSGQIGVNIPVGEYRSSPVQVNSNSWNNITTGTNHVIAIKSDNTLWGWGNNNLGQIGQSYPNTEVVSSPVQIGSSTYSSIDAGNNYSLAITSTNKLVAFGDNRQGQLGYTPPNTETYSWTQITKNVRVTLAIRSDGLLFGWGYNDLGQLGLNDTINRSSPTQIGADTNWSKISIGISSIVLAIKTTGALFTWGNNASGALGESTTINRSSPIQVGTSSWSSVSAGATHSAAIRSDSKLFIWGLNTQGQLGLGDTITRSSPVQVGTSSWSQVSAGVSHTLALRTDSGLFVWGGNDFGQLGLNDTLNRSSPVQIGTSSWSVVAALAKMSLAVKIGPNSKLFTWGDGSSGRLGTNIVTARSSPMQVNANNWSTTFNNNYVGYSGTLSTGATAAIQADGTLWMWGRRTANFLNDFIGSGGYSWSQISSSLSHIMALRSDGRLFGWGSNTSGQLGQSDTISRSSPVQVGPNVSNEGEFWYNVSAGENRTVAVRCDNTLWVWGANNGTAGLADSVARSSPVQLTSGPSVSWTQVSAAQNFTLALTSTSTGYFWNSTSFSLLTLGTGSYRQISTGISNALVIDTNYKLYSWGDNSYGQLGTSIAPLQWTNVFEDKGGISLGQDAIFALRSDSTLWVWGTNRNGVFGTNEVHNVARSSPVQVPGSWSTVGVGQSYALGIQTNGTLWGWGYNQSGILWNAYTINTARSSPVQMGSDTNWSKLSVGSSNVAAINNSGQLYTWGNNSTGQLGLGDNTLRSSPVQVPGSWTQISNATTPQGISDWALGLKTDGTAWGWGGNTNGQLGNNSLTTTNSPVQIAGLWRYVNSGFQSAFGIKDNYTLWGWGSNSSGELGLNNTVTRSSPTQIATDNYFRSITASLLGTLATRVDGSLFGWGPDNGRGTLGLGTTIARSSPTQVGTLSWSVVAISLSTTTGITAGQNPGTIGSLNNLYAWGISIGNGASIARSSPVQINSGTQSYSTALAGAALIGSSSWTNVSVGSSHSLGITSLGKMFAWGDNSFGKLGYAPAGTPISTPNSNGSSYIINETNTLHTWGYNSSGQLGDNTVTNKSGPTNITTSFGIKFKNIAQAKSSTNGFTLAIDDENSLWAWGDNTNGRLGDKTTVNRSTPVQISKTSWNQIAVGLNHSLGIKSDGTLWGWGNNPSGQAGFLSWKSVAPGLGHTLAIASDNSLYAWGGGSAGALGNLGVTNASTPVRVSAGGDPNGGSFYTVISAGDRFSMAIDNGGRLWAWGLNTNGQLGTNGTVSRSSPVQIGIGSSWNSVTAGLTHAHAIKNDGTLWSWGLNTAGRLGLNDVIARSSPVQVGTSSWSQVSAGGSHSIAISGFRLYAWGLNSGGSVGINDTIDRSSPVQVGTSSWAVVSAGLSHSAVIDITGKLFVFGRNTFGQLGTGDTLNRSSPVQVGTSSWSTVSAGGSHVAGISLGLVYVWGGGTAGRIGVNDTISRSSPTQVGTSLWTQVNSGFDHIFAIANDMVNNLYGWGAGATGILGINSAINRSSPVQVGNAILIAARSSPAQIGTDTNWSVVTAIDSASFAIKTNGTFYSWGDNTNGKLGLSDTLARSSPTQIGSNNTWSSLAPGRSFLLARTSANTVFAFGRNTEGQLGLNDTIDRSSPVQVGTGFTAIAAGESHSIALNTSGNVWTWGTNSSGQLGLNDTIDRSSPVQITALPASISSISGGSVSSYAIKGNVLYAWGGNSSGQLGDGTLVNKSSPVVAGYLWYTPINLTTLSSPIQIGSDSSWTQVSASVSNSLAITTAGTLFSWGNNASGQSGLNDTTNRSSPTQISASDQFSTVAAGGSGGFAIRSTPITNAGVIAGWGVGTFVAGASPTVNRSSPVQVYTGSMGITPLVPFKISTSSWTQIQTSITGATAIDSTGLTYTWGDNYPYGYLGNFGISGVTSSPVVLGNINRPYFYSPAVVDSSNSYTSISAGYSHALAIRSNGTLWSWGGPGARLTPSTESWDKIIAGSAAFWAIRTDSTLWAWGRNDYGTTPLGLSDSVSRSSPTQIGSDTYTDIATGESHVVAVKSNGTLWTWGGNDFGQLGLNDTINRSFPTQVGTDTNWSKVATGSSHTLVIKTNGTLWSYGNNQYGQLGSNITNHRSSPVQVGTSSWSFINAGGGGFSVPAYSQASLAIDINGYLYTWGYHALGADMYNAPPFSYRSSPVQIGTEKYLKAVSLAGFYTAAIRADGTLWWAGYSNVSGVGSLIHRSSPTQVGTDLWSDINVAGAVYSSLLGAAIARRQDGTLWVWGTDSTGRLGQGNLGNITSMVQVTGTGGSLSQFAFGKVGTFTTNTGLFLDMYGRMYISGSSGSGEGGGQRADNITSPTLFTITQTSTPTQIVSGSWSTVSAGLDVTLAKNSSGTLYGWGLNTSYQTGIGTGQSYVTSPVVIGSSTSSVSVGGTTSGYVKLR